MMEEEHKKLEETYNKRYAKNHLHKLNRREVNLYKKYIDLLNLSLIDKFTHLDIGSGLGNKTVAAGFNSKFTLGIDISKKAVEVANNLHQSHNNITFSTQNILGSTEKFDFITAFGLSLLNEKDVDAYLKFTKEIIDNNLSKEKGNAMLIGSFTDFSGGNETSWYYHTEKELEQIIKGLEELKDVKVKVVFPYKLTANYFNYGMYNFLAEVFKRFKNKRKNYFIVIEYE